MRVAPFARQDRHPGCTKVKPASRRLNPQLNCTTRAGLLLPRPGPEPLRPHGPSKHMPPCKPSATSAVKRLGKTCYSLSPGAGERGAFPAHSAKYRYPARARYYGMLGKPDGRDFPKVGSSRPSGFRGRRAHDAEVPSVGASPSSRVDNHAPGLHLFFSTSYLAVAR